MHVSNISNDIIPSKFNLETVNIFDEDVKCFDSHRQRLNIHFMQYL